jgi:biopolymer transport protein ExbB
MKFRLLQGSLFSYVLSGIILCGLLSVNFVTQAQQQQQQQNQQAVAEAQAKAKAEAEAKAKAEAAARAKRFQDIMTKINEQRANEAKLAKEREARFQKEFQDQERLLKDAQAKKVAAENLTQSLDRRYAENEKTIEEQTLLLQQHQGNLGELFGVTRQIAGDAAGVLSNSVINTQIAADPNAPAEDRVEFLRRIAGAKELPSIVELERLWFELMREMTEDSKTVRYNTSVLMPDNTTKEEEVVRVGSFTAVGAGKYLTYLSTDNTVVELPRQPPQAELMNVARTLQNNTASTGYVPAVVDPARGVLLAMFVDRPDIFERISEGEAVGYIIIFVAALGVVLAFIQSIYLIITRIKVSSQLKNIGKPLTNNPLGRMLMVASDKNAAMERAEVTELRISEAVLKEIPKLERFQAFLRLCVAAGPLLGLIGTVIGMIITFQSITASGTSDPKLMAHGIGQAMIATVLGLGCAIPLLFINSGLATLSRSVVHVLEEQSTQLLAKRLAQTG